MSKDINSQKILKTKAKLVRNFLKEKCNSDISHSQSLELLSKILGFQDWNSAAAVLEEESPTIGYETVGSLKNALAPFNDKDSLKIECDIEMKEGSELTTVNQEFSLKSVKVKDGELTVELKLEYENIMTLNPDGSMYGFSHSLDEK